MVPGTNLDVRYHDCEFSYTLKQLLVLFITLAPTRKGNGCLCIWEVLSLFSQQAVLGEAGDLGTPVMPWSLIGALGQSTFTPVSLRYLTSPQGRHDRGNRGPETCPWTDRNVCQSPSGTSLAHLPLALFLCGSFSLLAVPQMPGPGWARVFAVLLLSPPTALSTVGVWAWDPGAVVPTLIVVPDLVTFLSQSLSQPLHSPFTVPVIAPVTTPVSVCHSPISLYHSLYHRSCDSSFQRLYHSPCHSTLHTLYHSLCHRPCHSLCHRLYHSLPASASALDSAGHSSHYTAELSLSGRHPAEGSCNSRLS